MNSKSRQSGFAILEGLIAILIFSMAVLAVVGMQATAIGKGSESQYRADAAFLANQLLAQMWVHAGSGVLVNGVIQPGNAAASGVAAAPNLFHYHCLNCTVALATAAGTQAGDPEFVRWLQSIQGVGGQPGFLPGVTDAQNMPDIDVHCPAEALKKMPTCTAATMPASATEVTITLYWQKDPRGTPNDPVKNRNIHSFQTTSDIQSN